MRTSGKVGLGGVGVVGWASVKTGERPVGLASSAVGEKSRSGALGAAVAALALLALALGWYGAVWPLNQQSSKALVRRAQSFWDMRLSGDSLGAYAYMTDAYRRRVAPAGFARSGGIVVWTKAAVKDVQLDEKGGLVDLDVTYKIAKAGLSDLETTNTVRERWVLENGGWYRWPPDMGG
jgi:hypothetical protein